MTAVRTDFLFEGQPPAAAAETDQRLDAPVSDDAWNDFPWAERDPSASMQRLQTAAWIEEILADVGRER